MRRGSVGNAGKRNLEIPYRSPEGHGTPFPDSRFRRTNNAEQDPLAGLLWHPPRFVVGLPMHLRIQFRNALPRGQILLRTVTTVTRTV